MTRPATDRLVLLEESTYSRVRCTNVGRYFTCQSLDACEDDIVMLMLRGCLLVTYIDHLNRMTPTSSPLDTLQSVWASSQTPDYRNPRSHSPKAERACASAPSSRQKWPAPPTSRDINWLPGACSSSSAHFRSLVAAVNVSWVP